jgi:hypothetical protein
MLMNRCWDENGMDWDPANSDFPMIFFSQLIYRITNSLGTYYQVPSDERCIDEMV